VKKKEYSVGWVVADKRPYKNVGASTRIRCLDIINYLKDHGVKTGLYSVFKKYDIVVFQKTFNEKHYRIAKKITSQGARIILDINVNYFEKIGETKQVTEKQIRDLHKFLDLADVVLVSSHYIKSIAEKYHPDVYYIPEHISSIGTYSPKAVSKTAKLLYCGYASKADSVLLIKDILRELSKDYDFEVILVCDKNPSLELPVKSSFIKYKHKDIANILREGDIKIAPRTLGNSYDKGHSFTKIGYPMSVGLPVIAGPVPSYKETPALLAETREEWLHFLKFLFCNPVEYERLSLEGMAFVKENYSIQEIGQRYIDIFERLFHG